MKKLLRVYLSFLLVLVSVLFLFACKEDTICNHNDSDGDGYCDICKEQIGEACSSHVDNDHDCKCDNCGEVMHTDSDNNNVCDYCEEVLGRVVNKVVRLSMSATSENKSIIEDMVNYYNQYVARGYSVRVTTSGNVSTSSATMLSAGSTDIAEVDDQYVKGSIIKNYLLNLSTYEDSGDLDVSGIYPSVVNRFRLDSDGSVGEDSTLYAVPRDLQPTGLYYNATALKTINVEIISIAEEELDAYNKANGTSYLPHGFYEYESSPDSNATLSTINGSSSYKVFNDQIPMNWEELVTLSSYLTKSYNSTSPTQYGYYSEWWFNYGWSVGGDCLENGEDGNLKFTLCDEASNYLVTADATFNGTSYKAGELLDYVDKLYVASLATLPAHLYELPSQYDAFAEFCALSQQKSVSVTEDGSVKGYAVSPNPTRLGNSSRESVLSSKLSAFVATSFDSSPAIKKSMDLVNLDWGIAPFAQYREYNADGTLKTIEGTDVKGLQACHNFGYAFAISAKTKYPDECVEFLNWWISEEAQKMFIASGSSISCLREVNEDSAVQTALKEKIGCQNISPIISIAASSMQGDWSYVDDGTWITSWANTLNTDVRNGTMTIDEFWRQFEASTNEKLKVYTTKKFR